MVKRILFLTATIFLLAVHCIAAENNTVSDDLKASEEIREWGVAYCDRLIVGDDVATIDFAMHSKALEALDKLLFEAYKEFESDSDNDDEFDVNESGFKDLFVEDYRMTWMGNIEECAVIDADRIDCEESLVSYYGSIGIKVEECGVVKLIDNEVLASLEYGDYFDGYIEQPVIKIDDKWYMDTTRFVKEFSAPCNCSEDGESNCNTDYESNTEKDIEKQRNEVRNAIAVSTDKCNKALRATFTQDEISGFNERAAKALNQKLAACAVIETYWHYCEDLEWNNVKNVYSEPVQIAQTHKDCDLYLTYRFLREVKEKVKYLTCEEMEEICGVYVEEEKEPTYIEREIQSQEIYDWGKTFCDAKMRGDIDTAINLSVHPRTIDSVEQIFKETAEELFWDEFSNLKNDLRVSEKLYSCDIVTSKEKICDEPNVSGYKMLNAVVDKCGSIRIASNPDDGGILTLIIFDVVKIDGKWYIDFGGESINNRMKTKSN